MTGPFRLDRTLIRVFGPDAQGFLDNLLTQDVGPAGQTGVRYAALLSPQGKVTADMLAWSASDGYVIEADPRRGPDLHRRLAMYKLRADVRIEDASGALQALFATEPFPGALPDPRMPAGELGWRAVASRSGDPRQDGADVFDSLRLRLGIPDLARDAAADEVFALEALLEELNGVDFQKGCFVGQENVSRMKRRATTRRKFCPVTFEGEAPVYGTPVMAGEAEIGSLRTGAPGRAMALIRLDRAREALDAGETLTAAGRTLRLAPPGWLIGAE
jgi:folate-binding protein YgfZ